MNLLTEIETAQRAIAKRRGQLSPGDSAAILKAMPEPAQKKFKELRLMDILLDIGVKEFRDYANAFGWPAERFEISETP